MAPATFESVANRKAQLVRKGLAGAMLVGKYGTAPLITTLVASGGQIEVPDTYSSVGWISEDGLTKTKNRELSQVRGWGGASFLRQDVTSQEESVQFAAIEDNKVVRELYDGVNLDNTEMSAAGELKYEIVDRPDVQYWRACTLSMDGSGATRVYLATAYHKVSVGEVEDLVESNGDDPITRGMTLTAVPDDETGTLATHFIFGPGALAYAEAMGFTVAAA